MANTNDSHHFAPSEMHLKLVREVNSQYEIYGTLIEGRNCLLVTSNGTYELSGTYLTQYDKVDMRNIKTDICIVKEGLIYGTASGSIFFMRKSYDIDRSKRRFYEQQVISKMFSAIHQIVNLTDSSIVVLGRDSRGNFKTMLITVTPEHLNIENELTHKDLTIMRIISFDKKTFYITANKQSQKSKLIHMEASTFKKLNSINLDDEIDDVSVKMFKAFNGNIIIGYGNKIISCNEEEIQHRSVISNEEETSIICEMFEMKKLLVVFYKSAVIYLLNTQLQVVSRIDKLFSSNTLVRCELLSNFSLCLIFYCDKQWSLKVYSYNIHNEEDFEVESEIIDENHASKGLSGIFASLENCKPATTEEKSYSNKAFNEISSKSSPSNSERALIGLREYTKLFGTDLILSNSKDTDDFTNRLHATLLFNGFLNTNPYYYSMDFEIDSTDFTNMKNSIDLSHVFFQNFATFIGSFCDTLSEDIVLIRKRHAKNNNVSVDFTFCNTQGHEKYSAKENEFNKLKNRYIDSPFGQKKAKLIGFGIQVTLKECKLNVNIFNSKYDRDYGSNVAEHDYGKIAYYPPIGWTRLGFNIEYFGYKTTDAWVDMNKKPGEWAIAYHILANEPLIVSGKVAKDKSGKPQLTSGKNQTFSSSKNINKLDKAGFGKPCGDGISCVSKIDAAESNTHKFKTNDGKYAKLALMCRVNPAKLKIVDGADYYIVNNPEDIRPYAVIIKTV